MIEVKPGLAAFGRLGEVQFMSTSGCGSGLMLSSNGKIQS